MSESQKRDTDKGCLGCLICMLFIWAMFATIGVIVLGIRLWG